MRIGVEMIGTQSASRYRGIGRYCRNFADALRARGEAAGHEFVFYAVDGLPTDLIPDGPERDAPAAQARPAPAVHLHPAGRARTPTGSTPWCSPTRWS